MIPFNKPYVPEISKKYALEVLESNHQQGDGPFTKKASKLISDLVGGGHVLLTPSCTHALEMASMLVDIGPGDEVILPSYTFTSAATAITQFGATPVFVDIDPITKGIDANQVAEAVTSKTKAISWVNYAGVAPDIDALKSIASEHELLLIEDNAHGLGGSYKGRPLGSFGDFATQSFHATKNIQCGEGGALIVNNKNYIDRAGIVREKGTDRSKFLSGQVEKYQWTDKGSSYLLAEVLSAILLGQLENFGFIQESRYQLSSRYFDQMKKLISNFNIKTLNSNLIRDSTAHMFYLEFEDEDVCRFISNELHKAEISSATHYRSLHSSTAGQKYGRAKKQLIHAEALQGKLLRLPLFMGLMASDQRKICEVIESNLNASHK